MGIVAERHADQMVGFASLAYDTPGYGYGDKAPDGHPLFFKSDWVS